MTITSTPHVRSAYVMAQLGRTHPSLAPGIYAQAMTASNEDRERIMASSSSANISKN